MFTTRAATLPGKSALPKRSFQGPRLQPPGCTLPGYQCQAHHVTDWAKGGLTDIDDLTLACGKDNRLVTENGWRTRNRKDGRTEWIPPRRFNFAASAANDYHHPDRHLVEPEDP